MELNGTGKFENFSMMIPKYPTFCISGCCVNADPKEWNEFIKWMNKEEFIQLGLGEWKWDIWARNNDLVKDSVAFSLQRLFDNWKNNPPEKGFSYSYHSFPIKK